MELAVMMEYFSNFQYRGYTDSHNFIMFSFDQVSVKKTGEKIWYQLEICKLSILYRDALLIQWNFEITIHIVITSIIDIP